VFTIAFGGAPGGGRLAKRSPKYDRYNDSERHRKGHFDEFRLFG
jgi:hypothetical protein